MQMHASIINDFIRRTVSLAKEYLNFVIRNKYFFIPFTFFLVVYGIVWLAFYPGIMTPDSLDQWNQVLTGHLNNGSPYLSTAIMGMFRFIKNTPAWLGIVQIITTSALFSSAIWYGKRKGVSSWILGLVILLITISPITLIFTVTLWKDILYSVFVVAVSLLSAILVIQKSSSKYYYVALGVLIAIVAALRYNGIVYLMLPCLLILWFSWNRRKLLLYLVGSSLIGYIVLVSIVPSILRVDPAPIMTEWLRMKNVGAIYNQKSPHLTSEQRQIFEKVLTSSDWKEYYVCGNPDTLALKWENGVRPKYTDTFFKDSAQENLWKKSVISAALANPGAIIQDKWCMAGAFLQRKSPAVFGIANAPGFPFVEESPKLVKANHALTKYVLWSQTSSTRYILQPSIGVLSLVFCVACIGAVWRKKYGLLTYGLLNLTNIAFTILVGFSSDFRYGYSLVLGIFLLPIIWFADDGKYFKKNTKLKLRKTV